MKDILFFKSLQLFPQVIYKTKTSLKQTLPCEDFSKAPKQYLSIRHLLSHSIQTSHEEHTSYNIMISCLGVFLLYYEFLENALP